MIKKYFHWFVAVVFLALIAVGFYLLFSSRTGLEIFSPWQTISPGFVYWFAAATLVLGALIFSDISRKWLLLFFILYSLLLHAYLPLTHTLLYGADGWRHIANEAQIMEGQALVSPTLSSSSTAFTGLSIGSLHLSLGTVSYWQMWLLTILVAKISSLSLITVTAWLMPVLWSIAFPILLFYFGRVVGLPEKWSFVLVWLSALPFALQSAGSFTLPVNLSFLVWLGSLIVLAQRLSAPTKKQLWWLIGFAVVLTFGYALFAVLFWISFLSSEVVLRFCHSEASAEESLKKDKQKGSFALLRMTVCAIAVGLVMPILEIGARYSSLTTSVPFFANLKQLIGNFSAFYLADGPRPHTIATGNILFDQVPQAAFVTNFFTVWHLWLCPLAICFFGMVGYGLYQGFRKRGVVWLWLAILTTGLFLSYFISWYGLAGQHILVRRLDVVLAFLSVLFFGYGLLSLPRKNGFSWKSISIFLIIFSISIAASYSLGPATDTVTSGQYSAMQYIWNQEQGNSTHCVIAATYPLLALEAISKNTIIGGGFPIDSNFGQPELTRAFTELSTDPTAALGMLALATTKAQHCWFVLPESQTFASKPQILTGLPFKQFGEIFVWRYNG